MVFATGSTQVGERGVWGGGYTHPGSPSTVDVIDYVTISNTGNATDFGDRDGGSARGYGALSNGINGRGLFGGDRPNGNIIEYININTPSNTVDFGDLSIAREHGSGLSNGTDDRGIFGGGSGPAYSRQIEYVTISTLGNAAHFGT